MYGCVCVCVCACFVCVCLSGHGLPNHHTATWSADATYHKLGRHHMTPKVCGSFEAKIEVRSYIYCPYQ